MCQFPSWKVSSAVPRVCSSLPWGTGKGRGFWQEQGKIFTGTKAGYFRLSPETMAWATLRLLRVHKVKSICVSLADFYSFSSNSFFFLGVWWCFPNPGAIVPLQSLRSCSRSLALSTAPGCADGCERAGKGSARVLRKLMSFQCSLWASVSWAGLLPLWRGLSEGRGWRESQVPPWTPFFRSTPFQGAL